MLRRLEVWRRQVALVHKYDSGVVTCVPDDPAGGRGRGRGRGKEAALGVREGGKSWWGISEAAPAREWAPRGCISSFRKCGVWQLLLMLLRSQARLGQRCPG